MSKRAFLTTSHLKSAKTQKVKGAIGSGEVYLMAGVEGFCSTGNLTWLHTVSWKDTQAETGNPG